jgi:hypothetical protein
MLESDCFDSRLSASLIEMLSSFFIGLNFFLKWYESLLPYFNYCFGVDADGGLFYGIYVVFLLSELPFYGE